MSRASLFTNVLAPPSPLILCVSGNRVCFRSSEKQPDARETGTAKKPRPLVSRSAVGGDACGERGEERRRPPPRGRRHRVCIHVTGLAFQEKTTVRSALPLGTGWPSEWPDSSEPAGRSRRPRLSQRRAAPWSGRLAAPRGVPSEAGRLSPACHRRAAHADAATAASRRVPWSGGRGLHLEARRPAARRRAVCAHVPALE